MRKTCLDMVYKLAKDDPRIVFIGSDLGYGTLDAFKEEMPDRFFMEGIMESHVVGMAAGMAMEGKIVYVNTIASFLTRRCYEQIVLDLCLHNVPVRLIGNGGGLVYAPLGPTHETIEDIATMRALPNMTVFSPADAEEMARLMPATVDLPGPAYIRLGKGYDPIVTPPSDSFEVGKGIVVRSGKDALIVTTGVMLGPCLEAADILQKQGVAASILHTPTVKPFDADTFIGLAAECPTIVTVEEHSIMGGLGSIAAELLAEACFAQGRKFARMGIPDAFADEYGSQKSLWERYGLTGQHIADKVQALAGSTATAR